MTVEETIEAIRQDGYEEGQRDGYAAALEDVIELLQSDEEGIPPRLEDVEDELYRMRRRTMGLS